MAEVGVGASAYLESLKDENKAMEEQIQEMEAMATRSLTAQPTEALEKTLPQKGIKILSWNPPVLSEAGVDHGSEWRDTLDAEDKSLFATRHLQWHCMNAHARTHSAAPTTL